MGGRRKSVETEGASWRASAIDYDVEHPSLSRIHRPATPILFAEDKHAPGPPDVAPPLVGNKENTILKRRATTIRMWTRGGDASYQSISFNWRGNLPPILTKCARAYMGGVDVDCDDENLRQIAQKGDNLNRLAGEIRISARHSQGISLSRQESAAKGLSAVPKVDPVLVSQVQDYHYRGVAPLFRGGGPIHPRIRGPPLSKTAKLRNLTKTLE